MSEVKGYYLRIEDYDWVDVADHFKGVESFFHRNRRRVVINLIRLLSAGFPIVDAGCGTGLILQYLPAGSIGIDINPRCLKRARKHAPQAMLIQGDLENMPIRGGVFSTIVCTETLEHLPNPRKALDHFLRILNPLGLLIGSVPHRMFLWRFRVLSSTCPLSEPFHNEYKIDEVTDLLGAFRVISIRYSTLRLNIVFVVAKNQ